VRQHEQHPRGGREEQKIAGDQARPLHEVAPEEQLLGGGLDRGEDERQEGERHEGREVRSEGERRGVDEELDEGRQDNQHEQHAEARPHAAPVYGSPAGDEREGVPPVDQRHREQGAQQERHEGGADDQVAGDRPHRGRLRSDLPCGNAQQGADREACPTPHDEPHEQDKDDAQKVAWPGILAPPAGLQVAFVHAATRLVAFGSGQIREHATDLSAEEPAIRPCLLARGWPGAIPLPYATSTLRVSTAP
jgi:hypothetical protein